MESKVQISKINISLALKTCYFTWIVYSIQSMEKCIFLTSTFYWVNTFV